MNRNIKKPFWVNVVALIMMLSGSYGVLVSIFSYTVSEYALETQEKSTFVEEKVNQLYKENANPTKEEIIESEEKGRNDFKRMDSIWNNSLINSISKFVLSFLNLAAGLMLMMLHRYAVNIFYLAIGLSVSGRVYSLVLLNASEEAFMKFGMMRIVLFLVIDAMLLLTVIIGDKGVFKTSSFEETAKDSVKGQGNILWKIYFFVLLFLCLLNLITLVDGPTNLDIISNLNNLVILIGLYGFIYDRSLFLGWFWHLLLVVSVVEILIHNSLYSYLYGGEGLGESLEFPSITNIFFIPAFVGLYLYAKKLNDLKGKT